MFTALIETLRSYTVIGLFRLVFDILKTRLCYRKARLIRSPLYMRGGKYIDLGLNLTTGVGLRIEVFPQHSIRHPVIKFGKNCQLNDYVHIGGIESITFGDDVLIASKVFITDHNHGSFTINPQMNLAPRNRQLSSSPVSINSNVWLGENVQVLPGVTIGKNSIVGAGSVVTKDIPEDSIAVGNPARVIKKYDRLKDTWTPV